MQTSRRQRVIYGQTAWMLATIIVFAAVGSLALDLFVMLSLVGLMIVVELTAPINITPRWRKRLRWVIVAGLVIFCYLVINRLLEIIPEEVLF